MEKLFVEKLSPTAKLPTRAYPNDAGLDFYSDEELILAPGEYGFVKTNIRVALPPGYVALFWDKGGLASKHGLHILGGVFDAGYSGDYSVVVINLGPKEYKIELGQKITQLLIQKVETPEVVETTIDEQTDRGDKRCGSSGLH